MKMTFGSAWRVSDSKPVISGRRTQCWMERVVPVAEGARAEGVLDVCALPGFYLELPSPFSMASAVASPPPVQQETLSSHPVCNRQETTALIKTRKSTVLILSVESN